MDRVNPIPCQVAASLATVFFAVLCAPALPAQTAESAQLHSVQVNNPVEHLDVLTGAWTGGSLSDLQLSDGDTLDLEASTQTIECLASGIGASASPLALVFQVDSEISGPPGPALQSIALRDFTSMAWIPADTRWLAPGGSVVTRVSAPGDPARFLQPGTRQVEARITYQWSSSGSTPAVAIDAMGWQARAPAKLRTIDLRGYDAPSLNTSQSWIRTVFDLDPSRMLGTPDGVRLAFDVTDPGPFDYTFRAELRETNITTYPKPGTTQVYRMRFDVLDLPDLYGPVTIFQRFSVANNGPDLEVELTGANQFFDAIPGDLQVVAFGDRLRLGKFLQPKNELAVAIYNSAQGGYRVSLNGEVLYEASGLDTRAAPQGSWTQFGLYPHGLHDAQNRADQIASGFPSAAFRYESYSKLGVKGELDLATITTMDPN